MMGDQLRICERRNLSRLDSIRSETCVHASRAHRSFALTCIEGSRKHLSSRCRRLSAFFKKHAKGGGNTSPVTLRSHLIRPMPGGAARLAKYRCHAVSPYRVDGTAMRQRRPRPAPIDGASRMARRDSCNQLQSNSAAMPNSTPFDGRTRKGTAMNFAIERLEIEGLLLVHSKRFDDARGHFMETWSRDAFRHHGIDLNFVQDNQSLSARRGTVRGLHFQLPPFAQAKLVRVLHGSVFDVAVDLRCGSPQYGRWCATMLTASRPQQLYVPKGFAHGFATLEPNTVVAYKVDASYAPQCDAGIHWQDPDIAIEWPLATRDAVLSPKDSSLPAFADFSSPFFWEKADRTRTQHRSVVPA